MKKDELKKNLLKKVATKINEASRGTTKRGALPGNVIDLARERAKRRFGKLN